MKSARDRWLVAGGAALVLGACQDAMLNPNETVTQQPEQPSGASAPLDSGYVMRDGMPLKVVFEVRDGRAVFEGDIDLGPVERIARTREEVTRRDSRADEPRFGVVTSSTSRRWGNGRVAYVIESTFPNPQRAHDAMAHIEGTVAGIDFAPRSSYDSNYIIFRRTTNPDICGQSAVGRQGGGQELLVHDNCGVGTVIHELGHALGFWHEQSRCDRDSYVQILWGNVKDGYSSQFNKYCTGAVDVDAYNEGSVMHYGPYAFSKNGQPTIRSLRGLDNLMGQRSGLSQTDVNTVNWMYQPFAPSGLAVTYGGGTPTISWNASNGASWYYVNLVIVYEEYNDYEGTANVYDHSSDGVGTTTSLSLQDTQRAYTGTHTCVVYSSIYGSTSYTYWYEVGAWFPGGIYGKTTRWPAEVAPSSC